MRSRAVTVVVPRLHALRHALLVVALSATVACGGSSSSPTTPSPTPVSTVRRFAKSAVVKTNDPSSPPSLVGNQFAAVRTTDFRVPVVAEDVDGNVYAPYINPGRAGSCPYAGDALLLRPDGHKIVVRYGNDCQLSEAIVDQQVILFGNYSSGGTVVDIAVLNPGGTGTIPIFRGIRVQPAPVGDAIMRSFRTRGNVTPADTTAADELAMLKVLSAALSGWSCTEMGLAAIAAAPETFGGSLAIAAAMCSAPALKVFQLLDNSEGPAVTGSEKAVQQLPSVIGCGVGNWGECISVAVETAEGVFEVLEQQESPSIASARQQLSAPGTPSSPFPPPPPVPTVDVTGTWTGRFTSANPPFPDTFSVTLKQSDQKVTGTYFFRTTDACASVDGTLGGNTLLFTWTAFPGCQDLGLSGSGSAAIDGSVMTGVVSNFTFVLTR